MKRTIACLSGLSLAACLWVGGAARADHPAHGRPQSRLSPDDFHAADRQLRELIQQLLDGNPSLAVAWAESDVLSARSGHGRVLPDPELHYTYWASPPETRVGPQRHSFELRQKLPWKGKRRASVDRVERLAEGAEFSAEARAQALVASLKSAYFETAFLREALLLNGEERELLERFESIALKRYSTGEGIQQNVIKVQRTITRLDDERADLRLRLEMSWARISALVGAADSAVAVPVDLATIAAGRVDPDEILAESGQAHAAVRAAESRIAAQEAATREYRLRRRPDWTVGLQWTLVDGRTDAQAQLQRPEGNGTDIIGLKVGVNLPLARTHRDALLGEATAQRAVESARRQAAKDGLRLAATEAALRMNALEARLTLYSEGLLPQAEEALGSAEAAYSTNRIGFLDLLDAERVLFGVRPDVTTGLVADTWVAAADIEYALGRRFPEDEDIVGPAPRGSGGVAR